MGLMDRDYMHEKRPRQAFTPAPEKSAVQTLFMVLVFVAALFLLYKLADWQLNKRDRVFAAPSVAVVQPTPSQTSTSSEASPPPRQQGSHTYPEAPESTAGNRIVTKCVVNGKTSYGDGSCASGAVAVQVTTRADHNIMAPVRVAATVTTETAYRSAPVSVAQNTAPSEDAGKKLECQSLETHIQHLDSMGRQPQSGQMMDWIRDERTKARDRQFRIPCR
jgi:hypothetical protein